MTRFEEAAESPIAMSVMVAFCIMAYLEQKERCFFTDGAKKEFMSEVSEDIREWLCEESEESKVIK